MTQFIKKTDRGKITKSNRVLGDVMSYTLQLKFYLKIIQVLNYEPIYLALMFC